MARSNYLVHWTGKTFVTDPKRLSNSDRGKYLKRLRDILQQGFWMTRPKEGLIGRNVRQPTRGSSVSFSYDATMTCFTELRLSQSIDHAGEYGLLGIGVDRKYVLDRCGGPVHYVRNHIDDEIVGAFADLRAWIAGQNRERRPGCERADQSIKYLGTFFKGMSEKSRDDFRFLDENEWRVVYTPLQVEAGNILPTGKSKPAFRLRLGPEDIRIIVFPDYDTRAMALSDPIVSSIIEKGKAILLLTLEECQQL
jgi:hypothetical protein